MPPDGEEALVGPGRGKMDYGSYLEALMNCTEEDAPAIIKNVPAGDYAEVRDYMLRMSDQFELA